MNRRYLGIDYGIKRMGLAIANGESRTARAFKTIEPSHLAEIIEINGPFELIVVGLPRGLDGQETAQTLAVRRITADVIEKIGPPVEFQDEAATSSMAEERLRQKGKKYSREQIDSESAAIILQDWLDNNVDK